MNEEHRFADLAAAVSQLEDILATLGIEITNPAKSPFKHGERILRNMDDVYAGRVTSDNSVDKREDWRRAFSLGDLALKLVAAHKAHPDEFKKLVPHLGYLAGDAELSLCSFARGGHSGSLAEQQNDFIAELRLAASCILMMEHLEFDPPSGKKQTKGQNPDIIGRFNGKRWAVEFKTLHPDSPGAEQNPEAFLSLVKKARDQIKAAITTGRADTGIVVMNMKNTVDPDSFLPMRETEGEIYYGSQPNLPQAAAGLIQRYNAFITPIASTLAERDLAIAALLTDPAQGGHPAIAPCVIAVYFVIDGIERNGRPTLTMLRTLQIDPEPQGDVLQFAQKLNSCLQDQPDHPPGSPIGDREDFFRWAANHGPCVIHEREVFDPDKFPAELAARIQELQASGKDSLKWEETDSLGNKVERIIWKKPRPKADTK